MDYNVDIEFTILILMGIRPETFQSSYNNIKSATLALASIAIAMYRGFPLLRISLNSGTSHNLGHGQTIGFRTFGHVQSFGFRKFPA